MKRKGFVVFVVAVYLVSHYPLSCKDLKFIENLWTMEKILKI